MRGKQMQLTTLTKCNNNIMHGNNYLLSFLLLITTPKFRTSLQLETRPHLFYVPLTVEALLKDSPN